MDRSFLSQPAVIAASRAFVCIRLATYEDEREVAFTRSLFVGRSGEVENTTFALLASDGKSRLSRVTRSAKGVFTDATEMASRMRTVAQKYPAKPQDKAVLPALPKAADVRIGMDIAASDGLPLIVAFAPDEGARASLSDRLARLAWSEEFIGHFVYVTSSTSRDFTRIEGQSTPQGVIFIEPDNFGQKGKVVREVESGETDEALAAAMRATLDARARKIKSMREHRKDGIAQGQFWETKLKVTDPEEANARSRTKREMEKLKKP